MTDCYPNVASIHGSNSGSFATLAAIRRASCARLDQRRGFGAGDVILMQHLRLHINPHLGHYKLSTLTVPLMRKFRDDLRDNGRSSTRVRVVMASLGALLADALERGLVATNVVRSMKRENKRRGGSKKDQKRKLKVGIDIPTPDEIKRLIPHLPDKYRPLLLTAIFTGLRASELRGLRWEDVDLPHAKLEVCQRADRYKKIDKPKSESSERTVPLTPMVVNTLREWKLRCPKGEHGRLEFVFPTGTGAIEYHSNILQRGLEPAQIAAGIVDGKGKPKYALHEAFARLAVGVLPKEFEGLPPPVMIFSGVPRSGDEPSAVITTPSLPVSPPVALPQPEAEAKPDTDKEPAKELEPVNAERARAEPARGEPIKPAPIEYPETGWR